MRGIRNYAIWCIAVSIYTGAAVATGDCPTSDDDSSSVCNLPKYMAHCDAPADDDESDELSLLQSKVLRVSSLHPDAGERGSANQVAIRPVSGNSGAVSSPPCVTPSANASISPGVGGVARMALRAASKAVRDRRVVMILVWALVGLLCVTIFLMTPSVWATVVGGPALLSDRTVMSAGSKPCGAGARGAHCGAPRVSGYRRGAPGMVKFPSPVLLCVQPCPLCYAVPVFTLANLVADAEFDVTGLNGRPALKAVFRISSGGRSLVIWQPGDEFYCSVRHLGDSGSLEIRGSADAFWGHVTVEQEGLFRVTKGAGVAMVINNDMSNSQLTVTTPDKLLLATACLGAESLTDIDHIQLRVDSGHDPSMVLVCVLAVMILCSCRRWF